MGRAPNLSEESIKILRLFALSMDINGLPLGEHVFASHVQRLHAQERGADEDPSALPDTKTLAKY